MDRLTSILVVAGLLCFAFAGLLSGVYPWMMTDAKHPEATIPELAKNVSAEFRQLKAQYPVEFDAEYPTGKDCIPDEDLRNLAPNDPKRDASEKAYQAAYAIALRNGRDVYIAEACWHCHSQYVRPVSNEEQRFGAVRTARHYDTSLDRPVLWGTRRVGPDLTNEGGLRSNDWHVAHLYDPRATSPGSVMPGYTWYFHSGWQVRRRADAEVAKRGGFSADRSYPYPGLYASEADAKAALEKAKAAIPQNLSAEKERLFVDKGTGPTGEGLSLIAYLQWLGTYEPEGEKQP